MLGQTSNLCNEANCAAPKRLSRITHASSFSTRAIVAGSVPRFQAPTRRTRRDRAAATASPEMAESYSQDDSLNFHGVHHVGLLISNVETSLRFYKDLLGLEINPDRPDDKLPYKGAWLWIGEEMIHLMELPNPDPMTGRAEHGSRDRHFCVGIEDLNPLVQKLRSADVTFSESISGRRAVFFRDPDMNCLEVFESKHWH